MGHHVCGDGVLLSLRIMPGVFSGFVIVTALSPDLGYLL